MYGCSQPLHDCLCGISHSEVLEGSYLITFLTLTLLPKRFEVPLSLSYAADLARVATRLLMLVEAFDNVAADEGALQSAGQVFRDLLSEVGVSTSSTHEA